MFLKLFLRVVFKLKYYNNFSMFWWPLKLICDLKLGRGAYRRNAGVDCVTDEIENTAESWVLWVRFEPLALTDLLIFPVLGFHGLVYSFSRRTLTFDLDGIYRRVYTRIRIRGVSANTSNSYWNAKGLENPNKAFFSILLYFRPSFLYPIWHVTQCKNRLRHRRQR